MAGEVRKACQVWARTKVHRTRREVARAGEMKVAAIRIPPNYNVAGVVDKDMRQRTTAEAKTGTGTRICSIRESVVLLWARHPAIRFPLRLGHGVGEFVSHCFP